MYKNLGTRISVLVLFALFVFLFGSIGVIPFTYGEETTGEDEEEYISDAEKAKYAFLEKVNYVSNIQYAKFAKSSVELDLYIPKDIKKPAPLLVYIHGGGFAGGDKLHIYPYSLVTALISEGYAIASINYRLTSEGNIFPDPVNDCKGAIRWLRANAKKYNLNAERIGVWGTSAGGYLATMLGTSAAVKKYTAGKVTMDIEGDVGGNTEYSSSVQAVVDAYGPIDFMKMYDEQYKAIGKEDNLEAALIGGKLPEKPEKCTITNPVTYISKDDPPFLILHGRQDEAIYIAQSELLYSALKKNFAQTGKEVAFYPVEGFGHDSGMFELENVRKMVVGFFNRHIK